MFKENRREVFLLLCEINKKLSVFFFLKHRREEIIIKYCVNFLLTTQNDVRFFTRMSNCNVNVTVSLNIRSLFCYCILM